MQGTDHDVCTSYDWLAVSPLLPRLHAADDDSDSVRGTDGSHPRDAGIVQAARMARFLARQAQTRYRITRMMGDGNGAAVSAVAIGRQLQADFEDWCGTSLGRWPRPRTLAPMDVLVFAAHLQQLALQEGPLQSAYQSVADAGFDRAMAMLADQDQAADAGKRIAA